MKVGIKSLLVYVLIIFMFLNIFGEGIKLPSSGLYLAATIFLLALTIMIACPVLNFLTIKCKFPTFFLMSSLLLTGVFYLLKIFMTDFYLEEFMFEGMEIGTLVVKDFVVTPLITIIATSVSISLIAGIYRELDVE